MSNLNVPNSVNQSPKYKIVFLGDQAVGKTSIIVRFMYDTFDTNYQPTVGIDLMAKVVYTEEKTIKFHIWDTAGQERFHSLIPGYIRDSSVAIIVYDITNKTSFENTARWLDEVKTERGNSVIICLVGNKTDIQEMRVVSVDEGEAQAKLFDAIFMETSAKAGLNVKSLFRRIVAALPTNDTPSEEKPKELTLELKNENFNERDSRCFNMSNLC